MELPRRRRGDELLKPGELAGLRYRLRTKAADHDLASVIVCAFDHRTRMLPFFYPDTRMAPAGVRAIGSAMADAGFAKTRIVLQQWNPHFRPALMKLDGRVPDLFMVSSMEIHAGPCKRLIQDACRIDSAQRPLIIAGGPKVTYEPWDVFSDDPAKPWGADVAVTGEEYVLPSLLEAVLSIRARGEPLRSAFVRARDSGMLDEIPGLVYARTNSAGVVEELVDTGPQRLLGDLDELPHPLLGYRLLEPPSREAELSSQALPPDKVRKHSPISSLTLTFGCRFSCPYCPIPAYNQRQQRAKSGDRIADEFRQLHTEYGLRYFFGTDDNFFNNKARAIEILQKLAPMMFKGEPMRKLVRWGTEVTVHDALAMKDHLWLARMAGMRALWLGVEDMTATLIKKGQSVDGTIEAFELLRRQGINPMPMMMHHDGQPLYTPGKPYGLLNQVRMLRKSGAITLQVLMMKPSTGSRLYEETYAKGLVLESAAGRRLEPYMMDANYVMATGDERPWRKQFNLMAAYLYFYNPVQLLIALVRPRSNLYLADALFQLVGMWGLCKTIRRTLGWALRLLRGPVRRCSAPPHSRLPLRQVSPPVATPVPTETAV